MFKNLITLILLITGTALYAGDPSAGVSIFDKMNYQEVLEVTLKSDFTNILSNRRSEEDFAAELTFQGEDGQLQSWNIELAIRGKFRRMRCAEMPPLKLKFNKADLNIKGLSTSNDLKLVTQCIENEKAARDLLMKEYLTYKLYNQLTNASYRVQLLKINYLDSKTGKKKSHWSFLIEDTAQLRDRLGAKKVKKKEQFGLESINSRMAATAGLFQYMVGNHDWSLPGRKNVKLIRKAGKVIPVPYDFDFAGLVNAPYATANSSLGIVTRFDRVYLGTETDTVMLEKVFQNFLGKKEELISEIRNFKLLSSSARRDMVKYIETFFENGPNFRTKSDRATAGQAESK